MEVAWAPSDLKIRTYRSGNAAVCETCCNDIDYPVGGYGIDCGHCIAEKTPKYLTLTVSGGSDNSCYIGVLGLGSGKATGLATPMAGTYLLEQTGGDPCQWQGITTGSYGTSKIYSDSNCLVLQHTINPNKITFILQRNSTSITYFYRIEEVGQGTRSFLYPYGGAEAPIPITDLCMERSSWQIPTCSRLPVCDQTIAIAQGDQI